MPRLSIILTAGAFYNADAKGLTKKQRDNLSAAVPYADALLDAEIAALRTAHPEATESAVVQAVGAQLKARAAHFVAKGARLSVIAPAMPPADRLLDVES